MRLIAAIALLLAELLGFGMMSTQGVAEQPMREALAPLPPPKEGNDPKIALGRLLFFDRRLSRSMRHSCQSCHDLFTNGASGQSADRDDVGQVMPFNTPTVFNTVYDFKLGWTGRSSSLVDLMRGTLQAKHFMSGPALAEARLKADPAMRSKFRQIYGAGPDGESIADALAAFVASLVTPDAPFDRWMLGDRNAMTSQQLRGYRRFMALGCASCHQGVNVGGNLSQRRGIFHPLGQREPLMLRVPSLRNVAVTPPYFHDGSVQALTEAIRQMARSQLDLTIGEKDAKDIEVFLGALTGNFNGRPLRRPARITR